MILSLSFIEIMNRKIAGITVTVLLALFSLPARADVQLNGLFSDGAVLQQSKPIPVWGSAAEGEKVTVQLEGQKVSTLAKDGRWLVHLKPLKAGGPFTMTVQANNTVSVTNILVGEVWLCSGQSNMEFPLSRAANAEEAIAASADSQLRLFTVPRASTDAPKTEITGSWKESGPNTAANFSAVAWFFGRDLRKARGMPIGLIHSSVGGTPAEAWTSRATLVAEPELNTILTRYDETIKKFDPEKAKATHEQALQKYREAAALAQSEGRTPPRAPRAPQDPSHSLTRPCGLYNAMIAPLQPYAIAGAIWYQGEANSGRAAEYRKLFPAMIRNWRQAWDEGNFPFLFVQIAPYKDMTPEIREAQLLTWQTVPHTAMAVITDVGEENDIHPTKKEPVGARLALAARAVAYGEKVEYSGPLYHSIKIDGDRAILSFTHTGSGLSVPDGELKGFAIAGADGNFLPATALLNGQKVIVRSASAARPMAVRYGWAHTPEVNLFNNEGLPASPFRTDAK
jgi:sialate O-acetylesterase